MENSETKEGFCDEENMNASMMVIKTDPKIFEEALK